MLLALALVLLAIVAVCFWHDWRWSRSAGYFPFLTFLAAYYFMFFGLLPIWTSHFQQHPIYPLQISPGTGIFVVLFVLCQIAGFIALSWWRKPLAFPAPDTQHREWIPLLLLGLMFVLGYFLFSIFPVISQIPSVNQLEQPVWNFGFALLVWLAFRANRSGPAIAAVIALFCVYMVLNVLNGLITQIAMTILIAILAAALSGRMRTAVVGIAAVLLVMTSYGYAKYAARTLYRGEPTGIFQFQPDFSGESLLRSIDSLARRSSHSLVLQKVMDKTPGEIPFAQHTPFRDAVRNHIPRILWPDKPHEQLGNWFGKRYGFIGANDNVTSWNVPWAAEFYLTFGFAKALLAAFVIGAGLGIAVTFLSGRRNRAVAFGIFAAAAFPLFYQESNFSVMTGSLFWVVLFCAIGTFCFLFLYRRMIKND